MAYKLTKSLQQKFWASCGQPVKVNSKIASSLEVSTVTGEPVPVTWQLLQHLKWWENQDNLLKGSPLHQKDHNLSLYTDASEKGWRAHLGNQRLSGVWSIQEKVLPINILELRAVYLALKGFKKALTGHSILICSDNSLVVII